MKIYVEIPGNLNKIIDAFAASDGHNNRSAVIRKAVQYFFNPGCSEVKKIPSPSGLEQTNDNALIAVELDDAMVFRIDQQAKIDGHSSRAAVVRKALCSFFNNCVAFVASDAL